MKIDELVKVWKNDVPPSENNPREHNKALTLKSQPSNLVLIGNVEWVAEIKSYVFTIVNHKSGLAYETDVGYIYDSYDFSRIIKSLNNYGIYKTRGIYEMNDPPASLDSNVSFSELEEIIFQ